MRFFISSIIAISLAHPLTVWSQTASETPAVDVLQKPSLHRGFEYVPQDSIGILVIQTPESLDNAMMEVAQSLPDDARPPVGSHPSLELIGTMLLADPNVIDRSSPVILAFVPHPKPQGQPQTFVPHHMMLIAKAAKGITQTPAAGTPDSTLMPSPKVHLVDGLIIVTNSIAAPEKQKEINKLTDMLPSGQIRIAVDFQTLWKHYGFPLGLFVTGALQSSEDSQGANVNLAVQSLSEQAKDITTVGLGIDVGTTSSITLDMSTTVHEPDVEPNRKLAMMASRLRHGTVFVAADQTILNWAKALTLMAAKEAEEKDSSPQAKVRIARLAEIDAALASQSETGAVMSVELYDQGMGFGAFAGTNAPEKYISETREMLRLLQDIPGIETVKAEIGDGDTMRMEFVSQPNMQSKMARWFDTYGKLEGSIQPEGDDMVAMRLKSGQVPDFQTTQINQLAEMLGGADAEVRLAWAVNTRSLFQWSFGVMGIETDPGAMGVDSYWMLGTLERKPLMWQLKMRLPVQQITEALVQSRASRSSTASLKSEAKIKTPPIHESAEQRAAQPQDADGLQRELLQAIRKCDQSKMKQLLAAGASATLPEKNGSTPLMIAAGQGCIDAIEIFIANGAHVDAVDSAGMPAMAWAVKKEEVDSITALIAAGFNVNACMGTENPVTPLGFATIKNKASAVNALIKSGAEIDKRCGDGPTPLQLSTLHAKFPVTYSLVEAGADVAEKSSRFGPPLVLAAQSGRQKLVITCLLANGANVNATGSNGQTALYEAAKRGDLLQVKELLSHGADPLIKDNAGHTALFAAENKGWGATSTVKARHEQVIEALETAIKSQSVTPTE